MSEITILCSDEGHPVNVYLNRWMAEQASGYNARLVRKIEDVGQGDFLFLVSCIHLVKPVVRERFRHALVLHSSDLPQGRGWSPHVWSILEGANQLTVSLLTAADPVDSGAVFHKELVPLDGTELIDEINHKLFEAELTLMS